MYTDQEYNRRWKIHYKHAMAEGSYLAGKDVVSQRVVLAPILSEVITQVVSSHCNWTTSRIVSMCVKSQ